MVVNLNKKLVTKDLILNYIQDIDIYRFYSNKEVKLKSMKSPLRDDDTRASFGYFIGENNEIYFNDFVLGGGDCIKFVELMFGLNYFEALSKIVIDFNLHHYFYYRKIGDKVQKTYNPNNYEKKERILKKANNYTLGKSAREWQAYDLSFWQQFGIDLSTLKRYRVQPISYIFIQGNPIKADKYAYCFIEQKEGKQTYKIYQPFNKKFKWLNNHDASIWQGWEQLPSKGTELIITKSLKDVMSITNLLDIPSVALQAESTTPKPHIIQELKDRFKTIYILYDNDFDKEENWGQIFSKEISKKYDLINLCIPNDLKSKDFSDLVKNIDNFSVGFITEENHNKKESRLTIKEKIKLIWQCNIQLPF